MQRINQNHCKDVVKTYDRLLKNACPPLLFYQPGPTPKTNVGCVEALQILKTAATECLKKQEAERIENEAAERTKFKKKCS